MDSEKLPHSSVKKSLLLNRSVEYNEFPPFPHNMLISLTNLCNHICRMCAYRKSTHSRIELDRELLADILIQAYELGTREVGYYRVDEPFLSNNLEFAVSKANEIGYEYIYLTTNGSLATKERLEYLFRNGLNSIKFSVNAGNKETYLKVHGRDDFNKVIRNIIEADKLRIRENLNISMFVSFVETNENRGQIEELKDIVGNAIDDYYVLNAGNIGGGMYSEIEQGIIGKQIRSRCDMIFNRFHVTADGFLNACCADFSNHLSFANLKVTRLKDAWNNGIIRELRRRQIASQVHENCLCYNCLNCTDNEVVNIMELFRSENL